MHPNLILAILAVNLTFSTIGDTLAKVSGVTNNLYWFYLGLAVNVITVISFMTLIRLEGMAEVASIVLILTVLIDVFVGFHVFHEQIEPVQWVGIGTGILAVLLISNAYKLLI
jgi:drug/metabolite transporter (DMT)-like permease